MIKFIKNNIKVLLAFVLGIVLCGGVVYATGIINANQVSYNGENVEIALDTLYGRANRKLTFVKKTSVLRTKKTALVTEQMQVDSGEYILVAVGRSTEWNAQFSINNSNGNNIPTNIDGVKDIYTIMSFDSFYYWGSQTDTVEGYDDGRGTVSYSLYHLTVENPMTLTLGLKGNNEDAMGVLGGYALYRYE